MSSSTTLLLDMGNSRLKWALARGHVMEHSGAADHEHMLDDLRRCQGLLADVARIGLSDVCGGPARAALEDWLQDQLPEASLRVMRSEVAACGITNGYEAPEQLGVDRWMALLGARAVSSNPVLVVDCGTAVTLDALDGEGRHLGGLIAPGAELMVSATARRAQGVRAGEAPVLTDWPTNTSDAIVSGSHWAVRALVENRYQALRERLPDPVELLLTGGGATQVAQALAVEYRLDPLLVLRGVNARLSASS